MNHEGEMLGKHSLGSSSLPRPTQLTQWGEALNIVSGQLNLLKIYLFDFDSQLI